MPLRFRRNVVASQISSKMSPSISFGTLEFAGPTFVTFPAASTVQFQTVEVWPNSCPVW